jgi:hypothetical protein
MKTRMIIPVLICLCAIVAFSGCTGTQSGTAGQGSTSGGTSSVTGVGSTGGSLVTSATDTLPDYNMVTVDVGEKDYLGSIPVIFQGGMGQIHVKKIDVTLTRADGQVKTATIGTSKGDEANLEGTKQTDRVVVVVTMDNGQSYKIVDKLVPYRTRQ